MLSVREAQNRILERAGVLPPQTLALGPEVLGLVLAEDVASDIDMPPYDKSMMDGYAVRSADIAEGNATLDIIEEVMAGQTPRLPLATGQATRIMTGAPIPQGADAVVMVERCQQEGERVRIADKPREGQNILRRGREMRSGEVVLHKGDTLRPQELGLLATVGRTEAKVVPAATVAVLSTGDEIVEAGDLPGPGQIRNGNGPMLMAQARRAGGMPRYLGIAHDRLESLRTMVADGLQADVLVLSGGVSAGKLDLVPQVLGDLGVEAVFHKVEMKPGKPVLFGVASRASSSPGAVSRPALVFGLPGNPVSALVCFELFVRPALRALMGLDPGPRLVQAVLAEDYAYRTDRVTYHPALLETAGSGWRVRAVPWFGSPDLRGVTPANAFVVLPAGDHVHRAGQELDVLAVE